MALAINQSFGLQWLIWCRAERVCRASSMIRFQHLAGLAFWCRLWDFLQVVSRFLALARQALYLHGQYLRMPTGPLTAYLVRNVGRG